LAISRRSTRGFEFGGDSRDEVTDERRQIFVVLAITHKKNPVVQLMLLTERLLIGVAAESEVIKSSGRQDLAHPIQQLAKIGII
jgi:hypothetical protein